MKLAQLILFLSLFPMGMWAQTPLMQKVQAAQEAGTRFQPVQIFDWDGPVEPAMQTALAKGHLLNLNQEALQAIYQADLPAMELKIPLGDGTTLSVLLLRQQLLTGDFRATTSSLNGGAYPVKPGRYYAGVVKGSSQSLAAFSFFENEVAGVLETAEEGNMELGKMENDVKQRYALFQTSDLNFHPDFECGTGEIDHPKPQEDMPLGEANSLNCVRIYFECEYDMYLANGSSVQNTINFMTAVYNVVKTLYDNDGIQTTISEIFVWNTPDAFATTSTYDALVSFKNFRTNYNGDVAHLVSRGSPTGGGIAWLDVLCNKAYSYAYSYIYQSYSNFPTYSWTVNVITHEMGHNLGSNHTHDCVWDVDGNGTASEAIDGCGPTAGYAGSPGGCATAPLPSNGGSIMSYCHLIGNVGINLNNGFGPLPKAKIQNRVYNASCLSTCSNCTHTVSVAKTDVLCNGAATGSATATPSGGVSPFTYAWSDGAATQTISNLTAGTYTVTVNDANGCPVTGSVTINQPTALNPTAIITPESFPGAGDGSINLSVSGGVTPYTYAWSNSATTQDISNLPGGSYTVTVTDNNNCAAIRTYVVTTNSCTNQVTVFPYTESFESSFGLWEQPTNDGFDWTRRQGTTPTSQTGPSGAYQGSFYVFTESNGNLNKTAYLMSPCLDFTNKVNRSVTFAYNMNGANMGTLALQASNNNGGSWTTLWSLSGNQGNSWTLKTVSLDAYSSSATRIRFVGTVGNGQRSDMAIDAVTINAAAPPCTAPILSTSSADVSCFGGTDGTAMVEANGGNGSYTYAWSNGATTASITGLAAGAYTVTVTSDGCPETASVSISQPAALTLSFQTTNVSSAGANDGAINLTVSGGVSPFGFLWSNNATTEDISGLPAGTYSVIVTDANECTATGSATVIVAPACTPVVSIPYTESFETNFGLWTQSSADDFNWSHYSGSTPTKNTGPSNAAHGTWYLYTEATNHVGQTTILDGPCFDLSTVVSPVFLFNYHMWGGSNVGSLFLEGTINGGSDWVELWSRTGDQGNGWLSASVPLNAPWLVGQTVRLRFRGVIGSGQRSDMAIDYVRMTDNAGVPVGLTTGIPKLALQPNPASEEITVLLESDSEKPVQVRIADVSGRQFAQRQFMAVQGQNEWTLPVSELSNGMYWLIVEDGKERKVEKFVVLH
jgi:hypothetical protein